MQRSTARGWLLALILGLAAGPLAGSDWTHWRGPDGTGTSPERNLPIRVGVNEGSIIERRDKQKRQRELGKFFVPKRLSSNEAVEVLRRERRSHQ